MGTSTTMPFVVFATAGATGGVVFVVGLLSPDAYTRRDTKMVEAQAMREDIFSYAPYSRVGLDYERFTKEIINSFTF